MRDLITHIPSFLRDVEEYNQIFESENIELENAENRAKEMLRELTSTTAISYGLNKYEEALNIPTTNSSIEERRFAIKSKLINQLPFNMNWLENKLKSLVGIGNYTISLDTSNFSLSISISHIFPDIANNLNTTLRQEIPANLLLNINLFKSDEINTYVGSFIHKGAKRFFAHNNQESEV